MLTFRGAKDMKDWRVNFAKAITAESDEYIQVVKVAITLNVNLGDNYPITGHSLGGGLASVAALAAKHQAVTFNSAGIHPKTIENFDKTHINEQIKALRVDSEILTGIQENGVTDLVGTVLTPIKYIKDLVTPNAGSGEGFMPISAYDAIGSKFKIPAVDLKGKTMLSYKSFNPVISLDLHGMNYVVKSLDFIGKTIKGGRYDI